MAPPTWQPYSPDDDPKDEPEVPAVPAYQPPPEPRPVRSLEERTIRRTGPGAAVRRFAVPLGVLAIVGGTWATVDGVRSEPDERPQTAEGFRELLEDLEDETGSTDAFRAVVYPGYAIVNVPVAEGDDRYDAYWWDGDLDEWSKGTARDEEPFDLADVDPATFDAMLEAAEGLVEDPRDCYLVIEKPDDGQDGWILAYANNEYSQGGYITYDLDGTELRRTTW